MATVNGPVVDLNSLWNIWTPFFQEQAEKRKEFREWQVAYGAMEDLINSAPVDSNTYKEYYKYKDDLAQYGADVLRGSHPAGVMADRAIDIFRNYGRITGKVTRIQKELEDAETKRFNAANQHPGGVIFYQNDVTNNIDELANGKRVNNRFVDRKGIVDAATLQFANLGASLDSDPYYRELPETMKYSVEVLQKGGLAAIVLDEILVDGYSDKISPEMNGVINHHLDRLKEQYDYNAMDETAKRQFIGTIKSAAVAAASNTKANYISSGLEEKQRNDLGVAQHHLQERIHNDSERHRNESKGSSSRGGGRKNRSGKDGGSTTSVNVPRNGGGSSNAQAASTTTTRNTANTKPQETSKSTSNRVNVSTPKPSKSQTNGTSMG